MKKALIAMMYAFDIGQRATSDSAIGLGRAVLVKVAPGTADLRVSEILKRVSRNP